MRLPMPLLALLAVRPESDIRKQGDASTSLSSSRNGNRLQSHTRHPQGWALVQASYVSTARQAADPAHVSGRDHSALTRLKSVTGPGVLVGHFTVVAHLLRARGKLHSGGHVIL